MVAKNGSPINAEFFHHLSKLDSVNLLKFCQNNIARENNKVGLCILDMTNQKADSFGVEIVILVKVQVGG